MFTPQTNGQRQESPPGTFFLLRAAGIPVYLETSFLIILGFIVLQFSRHEGGIVTGLLYSLVLFGSVLLHEFGHALAARQCGVSTEKITLGMLGGICHLGPGRMTNLQDLWMTVAGPLVNVVIWGITYACVRLGSWESEESLRYLQWIVILMFVNKALLLFNLIPGWPLDGGRILACVLKHFLPEFRALLITSYVAQLAAVGIAITGLLSLSDRGGFIIFRLLIAWMIWQSAVNLRASLREY